MRFQYLKFIFFLHFAFLLYAENAFAAWHWDYEGDLGGMPIGMTLTRKGSEDGQPIIAAHYFYRKYLTNIDLKLVSAKGDTLQFGEHDKAGKVTGRFDLAFQKRDPRNNYSADTELTEDVLTGTWTSANGKKKLPVYLRLTGGVSGEADGSRCDLTRAQYDATQARIAKFHAAVKTGDETTIKQFTDEKLSAATRREIIDATPHDMFCNYQGIMLGSGVVWFDTQGKIITVNHMDKE